MRKKIFHNWGLKLGSVVIAFGLWLLVVQIYDPQDTTVFYGIPVTLTNTELLDQQDKVYEVIDGIDTVRVTVRAPKSVISELRTADIVAEADMSKLTEINTIAISYYVLNHEVYSVTGNPEVLKLNVEDRSSKWVGVRYGTVGEVAEGYMVYSVEPDQTRIEVSGPESAVAQISYASVQIDVTGAVTDVAGYTALRQGRQSAGAARRHKKCQLYENGSGSAGDKGSAHLPGEHGYPCGRVSGNGSHRL